MNALREAIASNDLPLCINILSENLNIKDEEENTPLHVAVMFHNKQLVRLLLVTGADKNIKNNNQLSALQCALRLGNSDIVKIFAEAESVSISNSDSNLLHLICTQADLCFKSEIKFTNYLISLGLNLEKRNCYGNSALHLICKRNRTNLQLVKTLLDSGAELNHRDSGGSTALHLAARHHKTNVVKYLVRRGANIIQLDFKNRSPLHNACFLDKLDIKNVKFLIENSGDMINNPDIEGNTPLMLSFYKIVASQQLDIQWQSTLYMIIDKCNINLQNKNKLNIIDIFSMESRYFTIKRARIDHSFYKREIINMVLRHLAKLNSLLLRIDESLLRSVSRNETFKKYFSECISELEACKNKKVPGTSVTFFDVLIYERTKLKNYAGNAVLVHGIRNHANIFPLYGSVMLQNLEKGIFRRQIFDESSEILSQCFSLGPTHLIIKDTLDWFSTREMKKLLIQLIQLR